jgi:hypothetical protein
MNEDPTLNVPASEVPPAPPAEDLLSPDELQTAREALPAGHICLLTDRVVTLEKGVEKLAATLEALIPLVKTGAEFAGRIEAVEKAVSEGTPVAPGDVDLARVVEIERKVESIAGSILSHFGINI